jgi:hypothetical protein
LYGDEYNDCRDTASVKGTHFAAPVDAAPEAGEPKGVWVVVE